MISEDEEQLHQSSNFPTTGYKAAEEYFFLDSMSPFFERFFNLGWPSGTRQKKLQNLDSIDRWAQLLFVMQCIHFLWVINR